jgi:hypothetical protein
LNVRVVDSALRLPLLDDALQALLALFWLLLRFH